MTRKNTTGNNLIPLLMIGAGVILIVGLLIGQLLSQAPAQTPTTTGSSNAYIPYANIQRVSPTDAKTALDGKTAVFVDVRDLEVYNTDHIKGAINIPLGDVETRYRELKSNQWIITYCT